MNEHNNKVCHLTSAHPRYDTRVLKRECVSLVNNGYEVWLLVNDEQPDEVFEGVHIKSTGMNYKNSRVKRIFEGTKKVYEMALGIDADIYQLHDPELLWTALKLKKRGKKVIFDSHECYYRQICTKDYLPKPLARMIAECYFKFETYIAKRIDGVITCCESEREFSFINRTKRVAYINNLPKLSDVDIVDRSMLDGSQRNICYSGSLTYGRGIKHIAEAAKKAGATLHLAGMFSSESFEQEIMGMAENDSIIYHGFLNKTELKEMYSKCAIGMCTLLPIGQYTKMGNLPSKAYEYMGMGMPVIISDFPYNQNFMAQHKVGLLVDPESIDDIVEKINYLFAHPQEAIKMGNTGRKVFEEECNWNVAENELLRLYKAVLDEKN